MLKSIATHVHPDMGKYAKFPPQEIVLDGGSKVIAGKNGVGKTALLKAIVKTVGRQLPGPRPYHIVAHWPTVGLSWDGDERPPVVLAKREGSGYDTGNGMWECNHEQIGSLFRSSGQNQMDTLGEFLVPAAKAGESCLLLVDEPENGLDLPIRLKLREALRHLSKRHQVIVSTHDLLFLNLFGEPVWLEEKPGELDPARMLIDCLNLP